MVAKLMYRTVVQDPVVSATTPASLCRNMARQIVGKISIPLRFDFQCQVIDDCKTLRRERVLHRPARDHDMEIVRDIPQESKQASLTSRLYINSKYQRKQRDATGFER